MEMDWAMCNAVITNLPALNEDGNRMMSAVVALAKVMVTRGR